MCTKSHQIHIDLHDVVIFRHNIKIKKNTVKYVSYPKAKC